MDIKDKISPEDKQMVADLVIEGQVLEKLLKQHNTALKNKVGEILTNEGLSPQLYELRFNPLKNEWDAALRQGYIIIPNQEVRKAIDRRKT